GQGSPGSGVTSPGRVADAEAAAEEEEGVRSERLVVDAPDRLEVVLERGPDEHAVDVDLEAELAEQERIEAAAAGVHAGGQLAARAPGPAHLVVLRVGGFEVEAIVRETAADVAHEAHRLAWRHQPEVRAEARRRERVARLLRAVRRNGDATVLEH